MNLVLKDETGLQIGKSVATLKIEFFNAGKHTEKELKALAILLGGYNKYGRKIDLDKHRERIRRFVDLIDEITNDIS